MQSKCHKEGKETSENKNVQISNKLNNRPLQQLAGFWQEATAAADGLEGKTVLNYGVERFDGLVWELPVLSLY